MTTTYDPAALVALLRQTRLEAERDGLQRALDRIDAATDLAEARRDVAALLEHARRQEG